MNSNKPRTGYTLPVFACAAAVAALRWLKGEKRSLSSVSIDLLNPAETVEISIEQVAGIKENAAIAIARSEPGDNLDITRNTPVWALVELREKENPDTCKEQIIIQGGEGIGRLVNYDNKPAIYQYAYRLLLENLRRWQEAGEKITVTIILPEGRQLATRTSNQAFGVVEGLALLGTTGISQPLSAPGQLEACCQQVRQKARDFDTLVLCIGENGLDLAQKMGIKPEQLIKAANWIGPVLVEAAIQGIQSILLFGYHGKLLKLAGGIFHTHHYLADGRREILAAHCGLLGLQAEDVRAIFYSETAEDALKHLRALDETSGRDWVGQIYGAIAKEIDSRATDYIYAHTQRRLEVGSVLFDRRRQIIVKSDIGAALLEKFC
ncbi:MAG: cobalt-precorrin-5B (C(1))-methyltransferase CbiD [Oscillatoriaceae bacterium SKW80]|nr:cobalt-precorrin-5B (C(1))-methyltransferase CbiD [Oscillatoriaceae bacterium SKYG93]MCX8122164.1 cobalt-precorrin-5B (C(1))-methyltransferase CbiD [Oscillatoriaceae bacterium SKW80]MDW8454451.1 cobalt-precorrin-5B (C(1))-methyltransferase CbiD [Oscillatoriaceae cyanobacterium SKYGB_i_bin93]HIK29315.1 cobalt-precorrin-5B (C(1))-methyltransferase [Oscillatoriaceae cyanobacterium M7585_C2015_266]